LRVFRARAALTRRRSADWVEAQLESVANFVEGWPVMVMTVGVAIWLAVAFVRPEGAGGFLGNVLFAFFVVMSAGVAFFVVLVLHEASRMIARSVLGLLALSWVTLDGLVQTVLVIGKLLLLIPAAPLMAATRLREAWRGIFYTCPARNCSYRGLPTYVCGDCGTGNRELWPNLYGLLWHHCTHCDARLPALELLGRSRMAKRCGGCDVALTGRHAGRARERLVAIVGAPGSGKTCYLLAAAGALIGGQGGVKAEIDEPSQREEFEREWRNLRQGIPAAKTAQVLRALLLYCRRGASRFQLYLYDAPGEEFTTIQAMTRQQYLPLLEGFLLLVDPLGFDAVRAELGATGSSASLQDVVTSTLVNATLGLAPNASGKLTARCAVVISKADLEPVKRAIGEGARESCRRAIAAWGGEHAIRALEQRFESVAYFACSPLGRDVSKPVGAFRGSGLLPPLLYVLEGA
jgi:energy-coupling factor transporter ATP-binding protein EcfA2